MDLRINIKLQMPSFFINQGRLSVYNVPPRQFCCHQRANLIVALYTSLCGEYGGNQIVCCRMLIEVG
jgi:hypothetical protein